MILIYLICELIIERKKLDKYHYNVLKAIIFIMGLASIF